MIRVVDDVRVPKHDVLKSEIRVKKKSKAIERLLKYFKNPKEVKE